MRRWAWRVQWPNLAKHSYSQNRGLADPHSDRLSTVARSVIGEANGCQASDDRQPREGKHAFCCDLLG
jgi:hypothetical protein